MTGIFYNETWTYDKNYEKGPVGLKNLAKPKLSAQKAKYEFLGFPVNLPFGIPAGPLLNSKFIKGAFDFGFDVVHYKTQRSTIFPCNEFPNVLFVEVTGNLTLKKAEKPIFGKNKTAKDKKTLSITNSFGNPSRGPKVWQNDMRKALSYAKEGQLLIASVVGTIQKGFSDEDYYDDFAKTAYLAHQTGVKVIELNLSCPNVANEGVICYTPSAVEAICRKTRQKIGKTKLLAKLGYFSQNQQKLLETVVAKMAPYVDGIAVINTIAAPVVDKNGNQALLGPNRLKSGVCGASIQWAGLDMVKRLQKLKKKNKYSFAIIGVGGMMTPDDFLKYRKAGADLVQSATGAMWNPYLASEIAKKLKQ